MRRKKTENLVLRGLTMMALSFFFAAATASPVSAEKNSALPADQTSKYAGSEVCQTCHEEIYRSGFEGTAHFKTTLKGGHGCESCHGPGAEHIAGGGDVSKIVRMKNLTRQEANSRCLSCHGENKAQGHFRASSHNSNDVGCLDCHSPHHAEDEQHLLVKKQRALCFGCHTSTKAEFARPFHHRVNEGLIQCEDCHNVHGTTTLRQVQSLPSGDAACFKCHADKQGPFVYEHVPVKTEGCNSCHTPHGSSNPRLLRVNQVNLMCLQCHSVPVQGPAGPAHNLSQKYQACTLCHVAIHGSNFSSVFFK